MSGREWKPGDVIGDGEGSVFFVVDVTASRAAWGDGMHAVDADWNGWRVGSIENARHLVVIDPEDREQVGALADRYVSHFVGTDSGIILDALQDALRSLIAPPKPEEPTGLGAVVEDADGEKWIRWEIVGRHNKPWCVPGATKFNRAYADIAAVKVLSEGVQP